MELHKLCANHEKLSPDLEQNYNFATLTETKTLGVSWKPNLDCFLIKVKVSLDSSYTKRDVLSTIAKIFDPVGLMAPAISKAKIFFQQVIEIQGFADASERCYGAAVYCKFKNLKSETLVRLITSKSRVTPIKSLTIPRLELCAAVLLAKLVKRVVAALQLETAELYICSDSMIVLAWLRKEPMDLKIFVQNRVAKIQELYPNQLWRHVPSDQNPADLVSRGVDPDKLLQQNLWFNGPTFLSGDDYPNRTITCREKLDEYNSELKNCVNEQIENFQSVLNIHVNDFLNDLLNLSNNFITILRVLSFIFTFVENLKDINRVAGPLTTKEFEKAETFLGTDDNRVRVWRRPGERYNSPHTVLRHTARPAGVMVWGGIAYDSRSILIVMRGTSTGQRYVDDILRPHVGPFLNCVPGAIFQQDNARPHTARVAQDFLRHFQTLQWPARSPDLSPVDHVGDQLKRQMPSCHSVHDLELAVQDLGTHLPQDNIRCLINSMPDRVAACIAAGGGPTRY
ncbi:uncharacterized protein TNCV_2736481 [Trichonephila clavipes]|nr:uncharacterized protein TNCV_2736481 [Trichonephila clavipes]